MLHAYLASDLSRRVVQQHQAGDSRDQAGAAVKFSAPVVANGLVYVPGESSVTVYGRLGTQLAHRIRTASTSAKAAPAQGSSGLIVVHRVPAG